MKSGKLGIQIEVRNDKDGQLMQENEDTSADATTGPDVREEENSEGSTTVEETKQIRLIEDPDEVDSKPLAHELVVKERKVFEDVLIVQERLALDDINLDKRTR